MIKKLIDKLDQKRKRRSILKKRKKIINTNADIRNFSVSTEIKNEYLNLWQAIEKPSLKWISIYAGINNNADHKYVPEDIYYLYIEPRLNNRIYSLSFADKNNYSTLFSDYSDIFPKTYMRKVNRELYNEKYEHLTLDLAENEFNKIQDDSIIIKPSSETSGGKGVILLKKEKGAWNSEKNELIQFKEINKCYSHNFLIQKKIDQHPFFNKFNETSVNTVRIYTYRSVKDNSVHILHSVLRVGQKGSIVDNQAAGGRTVGIDNKGKLNKFSVGKYGEKQNSINNVDLSENKTIPFYGEMKRLSKILAPRLYYHRLVAFDFCVTKENEVKLLEINLKNIEINFLQMNNGPLFKEFAKEIVDYCRTAPKSVIFDFYV